jgi:hypothetical protein
MTHLRTTLYLTLPLHFILAPSLTAAEQGDDVHVSAVAAEDEPGEKALAWMRFDNAPEQYAGKPYLWLGDRRIELAVDVKPAADTTVFAGRRLRCPAI